MMEHTNWSGAPNLAQLNLQERPFQRCPGSQQPDWAGALPEGVLLHVARRLDPYAVSKARCACKQWRQAFSLGVKQAHMDVGDGRAVQARAFLTAFKCAFPSTDELVLDISFRRTAREKIQEHLEEHFRALRDFGLHALQMNLDLNSFNERKIKLPDVSLLASWTGLTRLTLQESGWRSQQLRVDAPAVFGALPSLQELSIICKYSSSNKARWWRPPGAGARMPAWPPAGSGPNGSVHPHGALPTGPSHGSGASRGPWDAGNGAGPSCADSAMEDVQYGAAGGAFGAAPAAAQDQARAAQQQQLALQQWSQQQQAGPAAAAAAGSQAARPIVTQHLRCQMTQNQSMSGELNKALRRITPSLQPHITALTFEIVEETYAEPCRGATQLELSALPGLKSLTVLSGAEDALANSKLDIVGAPALESLVLFDVSCGCWCYNKPGHGIPPRLLSAPPACLRSFTAVGFVLLQTANLHALAGLTCLEELRLEQPDTDTLAGVAGELPLAWLPPSLRVLKLHSVAIPPLGLGPGQAAAGAAAAGAAAATTATAPPLAAGAAAELLHGVAQRAPLPRLRELYLSKCKVPALGVLGVCPHLTSLGLINCLSCSGLAPAPAAFPALRSLALIHTLSAEQELGPGQGMGLGPPAFNAFGGAAAAAAPAPGRAGDWPGLPPQPAAPAVAPDALQQPQPAVLALAAPMQAVQPGLPLPAVVWGSDEQVAAVAACRGLTSLELVLPRGTAGVAAVAAVAGMGRLEAMDLALPCMLGECMLGLARLGGGGRLRRLTLWVDSRTCVNRARARQLQAVQRNLQAHMPDTLVEWAAAESRHSSWTGLEGRVFRPH